MRLMLKLKVVFLVISVLFSSGSSAGCFDGILDCIKNSHMRVRASFCLSRLKIRSKNKLLKIRNKILCDVAQELSGVDSDKIKPYQADELICHVVDKAVNKALKPLDHLAQSYSGGDVVVPIGSYDPSIDGPFDENNYHRSTSKDSSGSDATFICHSEYESDEDEFSGYEESGDDEFCLINRGHRRVQSV
jgi:hypothetical protein